MRFVPFRRKILAAFLSLLAVVLGLALALVDRHQTRLVQSEVRSRLQVAREVFESMLRRRERQLTAALRLLSADFAFKQAMATGDAGTIGSAALNFRERVGADAVLIADEEGVLLADTTGRRKPGESLAGLPAAAGALEEEAVSSVDPLDGAVYQMAAVPIYGPDLIGILLAGFAVDDRMAAEIKQITLTDVSFSAGDQIAASTLDERGRALLRGARAGLAGGEERIIGPAGGRDIVLESRVAPRVSAYLQRSWEEALKPVRDLRRALLWTGLAALLLALLAGLRIAEGVTAPVEALARATGRLAEGDYGVRVSIPQRDEIGQLGRAFNRMVAGLEEREKIRSILRQTVSKEIAEEILKSGVSFEGEEKHVTVLFLDIRGFTTLSESLPPRELFRQLNSFWSHVDRAIGTHKGVIEQYAGDAIKGLFGAPVSSPGAAADAHRAALALLKELAEANVERRREGLSPWEIGVGLNTGPAAAGHYGSENRWAYTVIGDTVNLAARLEGLTKVYGVPIVVSRTARDAALAANASSKGRKDGAPAGDAASGGDFRYRSLDLVRVKGKHEPVEVFALLGEGVEAPPWLEAHEEGIRAYREGRFGPARELFAGLRRELPEDRAAGLYLERLSGLPDSAPAGWDPAHTMTSK